MKRITIFLTAVVLLLSQTMQAQQGQYLYLWGGPQYVKIGNYDDWQSWTVKQEDTYRPGFGLDYVYNFSPSVGFQTGLAYSANGQKFSGRVDSAQDYYYKQYFKVVNGDTVHLFPGRGSPYDFTSHVYLNYLRLPLDLRFNAISEDEYRVSMSMYFGLYIAYLMDVQEVVTNPAPPDTFVKANSTFRFIDDYHKIDFGIDAGAQFNVRITQNFGTGIGARFDRSFSNIEKHDISVSSADTKPVEWYPPVSIPKSSRPATDDFFTRAHSANNVVNVYLCFYYRLDGGKKRPVQ